MGNVGDKCNCFGGKGDKNTFVFEEVDRITPVNKNFNESVSYQGSQKSRSVFNNTLEIKDEETIKKIMRIQNFTKCFLMKIKFKSTLRKKYLYDTLNLLEKYSNEFRTVNLYKAESYKNSAYDPMGWKNFYKPDDKYFNYNFGKVYNCKLLVSKDKSSIYSGQVNIDYQKHGYGVLLSKDGIKYEGAWFNDKFNCWGKLIDQKGNNFQGKFYNNY